MKLSEIFTDLAAQAIEDVEKSFERQRELEIYAPLETQTEITSDGGNYFRVTVYFEPCVIAQAQPSRN